MTDGMVGIIGGTGLGDALAGEVSGAELHDVDTPFGRVSSPVLVGTIGNKQVAFLNRHGEGHRLSPSEVPFAANIFALKKLGVTSVIASGAVGSLREEIRPREVVVAEQIIDKTFRRQGTFFSGFGAVHCELSLPFCQRLREILLGTAGDVDVKVHNGGTYVCMEGPQFSTRAESLMHRDWGGDLIGMTAMPEARLAREAQMCYALVALVTDYDCWREGRQKVTDKQALLSEITENLQAATNNAVKLIRAVLQSDAGLCSDECPCRKSLELAVWTQPGRINQKTRDRLDVLFR
jgi:5'-methylthioadenosine phosphorylase